MLANLSEAIGFFQWNCFHRAHRDRHFGTMSVFYPNHVQGFPQNMFLRRKWKRGYIKGLSSFLRSSHYPQPAPLHDKLLPLHRVPLPPKINEGWNKVVMKIVEVLELGK